MCKKVKEIKEIINENSSDIAFIIGNGINRYYNQNISWEDLLLKLWRNFAGDKKDIPGGISLPEFYDILEIQNLNRKVYSSAIQKKVKEIMEKWKPNKEQNKSLISIKKKNVPILTTNFDDLIPKSLRLELKIMQRKGFNYVYPWSYYYSDRDLEYPTQGFGVWYINGMIKYHGSIRLGLSHYMGSVSKARKLIHDNPESFSFEGKNQSHWPGYKTWLHIIFNKSLFIFGLGLKESEVFIRWLLIEREKYYRKFPERRHKGWYLTTQKETKTESKGRRFFLESVGINVIETDGYEDIYEKIWE